MADEQFLGFQDDELLAAFMEEAREQLDVLDRGLVSLERQPDDTELIQEIFRAAHTLKGSSAAMGYRQTADLTHAMEDALDRVRQGTQAMTPWLTDRLLEALDLLRELQRSIEDSGLEGTAVQAEEVAEALRTGVADVPGAASVEAEDEPLGALSPQEVALLIRFTPDCQMPGLRAFMVLRALEGVGTVGVCRPSREDIDADRVGRCLLLTLQTEMLEQELSALALRIPEVEWVHAARGAEAAGMHLHQEDAQEEPAAAVQPVAAVAPYQEASADAVRSQQTVRVSVQTLDRIMNLVGELVLDRTRVAQLKDELSERHPGETVVRDLDTVSNHLGTIVGELHEEVLAARMLPVSQLFNRFPRMVRDLCRSLDKDVELQVEGETEQLDRSVIEKLVDPLTHLLRNAVDHGMEPAEARRQAGKSARGRITLSARRQEEHVVIEVRDDGPGLDAERLKEKAVAAALVTPERARTMSRQEAFGLVFMSGLSTAERVSDVSGRGVGMDVVRRNVEALGGMISVDSMPGVGTTFSLKIPLTLAIVRALIVRAGQVPMAVPMLLVEETLNVTREALGSVRGRLLLPWRETVIPVIRLADAMPGCGDSAQDDQYRLVVVRHESQVVALCVDAVLGHQEIVVKSLGNFLGEIPGLAGATILGNGGVALILDIAQLFATGLMQQAVDAV